MSDDDLRRLVGARLTWLMNPENNHWDGTQTELAEKAKVYQTHISNMMAGKKLPSAPVLDRLADALNTNTDYILGRVDDPRPPSDLDDQVVVGSVSAEKHGLLQEICNNVGDLPNEDLMIFLEISRRFSTTAMQASRHREEMWNELWSIVAMLGGNRLVEAFRLAMNNRQPPAVRRRRSSSDESVQ